MIRYEILINYLKLFFENHTLMTKEEAELIIKAIELEEEEDE